MELILAPSQGGKAVRDTLWIQIPFYLFYLHFNNVEEVTCLRNIVSFTVWVAAS